MSAKAMEFSSMSDLICTSVKAQLSENLSKELANYFMGILQPAIAKTSIDITKQVENIIINIK